MGTRYDTLFLEIGHVSCGLFKGNGELRIECTLEKQKRTYTWLNALSITQPTVIDTVWNAFVAHKNGVYDPYTPIIMSDTSNVSQPIRISIVTAKEEHTIYLQLSSIFYHSG